MYVPNVSSASDVCCIQVFHVASVSCFRDMFMRVMGYGPGAGRRGMASQGLADWAERQAQGGARRMGTGYACVAGRGRQGRTAAIQYECGAFVISVFLYI